MRVFISLIFLTGFMGNSVFAQDVPGDVAAGRAFALDVCSECHVVARDQEKAATDVVPTFEAIAANPAMTETALRVFLQTPHAEMPNFMLSAIEKDDIISYILSLRK